MAFDREVLPTNVKPTHYNLHLTNIDRTAFTYDGTVIIDLALNEPTRTIKLNAKQLTLKDGHVTAGDKTIKIVDHSIDTKAEVATLSLEAELPGSGNGQLTINFSGLMNQEMAGFYRSAYKNVEGNDDWMFSTQFESCDARRAFPCFDEPNLKAAFDFSIDVPEAYTALSNQPVKEEKKDGKGLKTVVFETAPKMSTYLYAWACGDFEYIEDFTDREYPGRGKLPVRVYTTRGLVEQGRFALENCRKIVDYFSEIFEIDYPLPKVDLLAVHEFSHGAMENWGLITYRTTAVLFDEKTSDARYKNRVAYVVAHELAHQWFGNLVTMDWWSELWLNEGFATWVGWLATDHFHPSWDVWGQFVTEGYQTAFQLDGLRSSHPIEVPVKNALEIDQIFDHISYLKGSSTIRMLSTYLGQKTFLKGVARYLKKHAYGNATTEDLWSALAEESGQDVAGFMRTWIKVIGFPVLNVTEEGANLLVSQSRFLSTGDVKPEEDTTTWWLPLAIDASSQTSASPVTALTGKTVTIENIASGHYKLNSGQTGFYRVNYPLSRLRKLGENQQSLSVSDKVGIIADAGATAFAGYGTSAGLLEFITSLKNESSYLVWAAITERLGNLRSIFGESSPELKDALAKLTLSLVSPIVERVGWDFPEGEDFLTGRLRALLISTAGAVGHDQIIAESLRRFKSYVAGDKDAIHPSLRLAVFKIAIAEGGKEEYDAVVNEYLTSKSVDAREICLVALGRAKKPEIVKEVLKFMLSENVKVQDKHSPAISLSNNGHARYVLWKFIEENWEEVHRQMSGNMVVLDRFLKNSLNKFSSEAVLKEIEDFFSVKDNTGYDRGLELVKDSIRGRASYVKRDKSNLEKWLKENGY
ncbi:hypothetical protein EX30DRAFT_344874 [Ascodesmis nigricans]|uniref:Aminopeptidase n=1 Tax=Ascodesmis nigricans TaxID=341454 RepID=A0A4S2MHX0_9PEZI|nr:hypothetical protein EX30DRAFT_344874 [Ascodesmis nigricans]